MRPRDSRKPREDRRIAKTQAQLSGALIELLLERGWDAIGVGELCDRADVARSTFYLHFANKEELLESGFSALRDIIRVDAPTTSLNHSGQFGFVEGLAKHIFENRKTFLALVGKNGASIVRERFRGLLETMIAEELAACGKADNAKICFLSGGFVSMAASCMATKNSDSQPFVKKFNAYAAPIIAL